MIAPVANVAIAMRNLGTGAIEAIVIALGRESVEGSAGNIAIPGRKMSEMNQSLCPCRRLQ